MIKMRILFMQGKGNEIQWLPDILKVWDMFISVKKVMLNLEVYVKSGYLC